MRRWFCFVAGLWDKNSLVLVNLSRLMDVDLLKSVFWIILEPIMAVFMIGMFWLYLYAMYHNYNECQILLKNGVSIEGIVTNKREGNEISATIHNYIVEYTFNCNPQLARNLVWLCYEICYILEWRQYHQYDIIVLWEETIESYNSKMVTRFLIIWWMEWNTDWR